MQKHPAYLISVVVVLLALILAATPRAAHAQPIAQAGCAGQTGLSQVCPIRLRFARGSYGVQAEGRLTRTPDTRYYVLKASAGQRMTLSFVGAGALRGGILFPGGSGDGPFDGQGNVITLPITGDYIIYLGQNTMAGDVWRGNFTLQIMVR